MLCADGQSGDKTTGQLIVRNTFLEFFDDSSALGPYEGGRRPRVASDVTDLRLPAKVEYKPHELVGESKSTHGADGDTSSPLTLLSVLEEPPLPTTHPPQMSFATLPSMAEGSRTSGGVFHQPYPGQAYPSSAPWCGPMAHAGNGMSHSNPLPYTGLPNTSTVMNSMGVRPQTGVTIGVIPLAQGSHTNFVPIASNGMPLRTAPNPATTQQAPRPTASIEFSHGDPTTIMLRNIPNRYTQSELMNLLDGQGFGCLYDFAYLPMDFRNGVNLGYAFVNFVEHDVALRAIQAFEGFSGWFYESTKVGEVSWSHPHQGLEEHIERYRNSPVMHHCMPDEYKPMLFSRGVRVQFPPPTKAIKAPKLRPARDRPQTTTN